MAVFWCRRLAQHLRRATKAQSTIEPRIFGWNDCLRPRSMSYGPRGGDSSSTKKPRAKRLLKTNRNFEFVETPKKKIIKIKNENIKAKEIILIDSEGKMLGTATPAEALEVAREDGYDLVQVAKGNPPICRFMAKENLEGERKRLKEAQSKMKTLKIVPIRVGIEEHDLMVKLRTVEKLLIKGHPVRIDIARKDSLAETCHQVVEIIHKTLVETEIGHSLDSLGKMKNSSNILLSPFSLKDYGQEENPKA